MCYPVFRLRSTGLVEAALDRVQAKLEQGFATIRFYVGSEPAADEAFLVGFADRFAGRIRIKSLDFSNLVGWRDALRLTERYAAIAEVMLVESVALRGDLEGLREYRQRGRLPVSEHVHGARHAWELLHRGCVDILNISPYVLGGLRATMRTAAMAEAAGVDVLIGTTQELNLGTAAVAHLGAVLPTLPYPPTMPALGCTSMTSSQAGSNTSMATSACRSDRASARWSSPSDWKCCVRTAIPRSGPT